MYFRSIVLSLSFVSPLRHAAAAPVTYGISNGSTFDLTAGYEEENLPIRNISNGGYYSPIDIDGIDTDSFDIPDSNYKLRLDFDRGILIKQQEVVKTLQLSLADVTTKKSDDQPVENKYEFSDERYNAEFEIEPTISDVMYWKDVATCIRGLKTWFNIMQNFMEVRFTFQEVRGDNPRGDVATGGLLKEKPSPPPRGVQTA